MKRKLFITGFLGLCMGITIPYITTKTLKSTFAATESYFTSSVAQKIARFQVAYVNVQTDQKALLQSEYLEKLVLQREQVEYSLEELVNNGDFKESLNGWDVKGVVEKSENGALLLPLVSMQASLKQDINISQQNAVLPRSAFISVEYRVTTSEDLPEFDQPILSIFLNNLLVFQVGATNKWQSVVIDPLLFDLRDSSLEVVIVATATHDDLFNPVVELKKISTTTGLIARNASIVADASYESSMLVDQKEFLLKKGDTVSLEELAEGEHSIYFKGEEKKILKRLTNSANVDEMALLKEADSEFSGVLESTILEPDAAQKIIFTHAVASSDAGAISCTDTTLKSFASEDDFYFNGLTPFFWRMTELGAFKQQVLLSIPDRETQHICTFFIDSFGNKTSPFYTVVPW